MMAEGEAEGAAERLPLGEPLGDGEPPPLREGDSGCVAVAKPVGGAAEDAEGEGENEQAGGLHQESPEGISRGDG